MVWPLVSTKHETQIVYRVKQKEMYLNDTTSASVNDFKFSKYQLQAK
jgi:hypothetical protein